MHIVRWTNSIWKGYKNGKMKRSTTTMAGKRGNISTVQKIEERDGFWDCHMWPLRKLPRRLFKRDNE